jgi:hypothetical protein
MRRKRRRDRRTMDVRVKRKGMEGRTRRTTNLRDARNDNAIPLLCGDVADGVHLRGRKTRKLK